MEWLVETANENYVATGVRQGRRGGRGGGGGRAGEEEELDVAKLALVVASGGGGGTGWGSPRRRWGWGRRRQRLRHRVAAWPPAVPNLLVAEDQDFTAEIRCGGPGTSWPRSARAGVGPQTNNDSGSIQLRGDWVRV